MTDPSPSHADPRTLVLIVARLVPRGRVVSYGDIAELVGIGPRQVGRILATHDTHLDTSPVDDPTAGPPSGHRLELAPVPWWRVTNTNGDLPLLLRDEAFAHYREEGTPIRRNGVGAAIRTHRADLPDLADAAEAIVGRLPGASG